jgi:hypothetical protein
MKQNTIFFVCMFFALLLGGMLFSHEPKPAAPTAPETVLQDAPFPSCGSICGCIRHNRETRMCEDWGCVSDCS